MPTGTVHNFTVLTLLESGSIELSYGTVPYGTKGGDPKLDNTRIEVVKCNQETVPYGTLYFQSTGDTFLYCTVHTVSYVIKDLRIISP